MKFISVCLMRFDVVLEIIGGHCKSINTKARAGYGSIFIPGFQRRMGLRAARTSSSRSR